MKLFSNYLPLVKLCMLINIAGNSARPRSNSFSEFIDLVESTASDEGISDVQNDGKNFFYFNSS